MSNPNAAAASNVNVMRRQQTSLLQSLRAKGILVPSQVDDGEFLVTTPRAKRRTRSIENSPAVRLQVKLVEPVDTELHPSLNCRQNELLAKYPLFFRVVHHRCSYVANVPYFDLKDRRSCYPTIEPLTSDFETSFGLCGASNTGILRRACPEFAMEVI